MTSYPPLWNALDAINDMEDGDATLTPRRDVIIMDARTRPLTFVRVFSRQPKLNPHTTRLINAALEGSPDHDVVILFQRPPHAGDYAFTDE
ncbi:MAG: hypothetical protein HZC41_21985 [Chloroflexi bacterium]|nr:hypothetical protein [Chloroflexota bacterium]